MAPEILLPHVTDRETPKNNLHDVEVLERRHISKNDVDGPEESLLTRLEKEEERKQKRKQGEKEGKKEEMKEGRWSRRKEGMKKKRKRMNKYRGDTPDATINNFDKKYFSLIETNIGRTDGWTDGNDLL